MISLIVVNFLPSCSSAGDTLLLFGAFRIEYNISDSPVFSSSSIILLLVLSLSFIVRISLSTLPLPR